MSLEGDRGFRCGLETLGISQIRDYVQFGDINPPAPQLDEAGINIRLNNRSFLT